MRQPKTPLLFLALALTVACGGSLKPKEVRKSRHTLGGSYSGTLDAGSSLVVSSNRIVATKTIPKDQNASQADMGLAVFSAGLYPKLREYCGACHATNAVPFASPGVDLAYSTARKFVAASGEDSLIIKNIRAGHNGVDPAWADELLPLVEAVAAE